MDVSQGVSTGLAQALGPFGRKEGTHCGGRMPQYHPTRWGGGGINQARSGLPRLTPGKRPTSSYFPRYPRGSSRRKVSILELYSLASLGGREATSRLHLGPVPDSRFCGFLWQVDMLP